jgi:hypothetical protein
LQPAITAFRIKTQFNRHRFKQSGFAGAVFAHKKCHRRMEFEPVQVPDGWNAKRICVEAFDGITFKPDGVKQRTLDNWFV